MKKLHIDELRKMSIWPEMQEVLNNFMKEYFPEGSLDDLTYTEEEDGYVVSYKGQMIGLIGATKPSDDFPEPNLN